MSRATRDDELVVSANTLLIRCPEVRLGFALPFPLSDRLDCLVEQAEFVGERTNRKELVAALVFAADADGLAVTRLLRELRRARAIDALVDADTSIQELVYVQHPPGPRPRR